MEPLTVLASTVVALVFAGVFEGLGQDLQKQLITTIREKFKASGTEGALRRAEAKPTESNVVVVEAELLTQMTEDQLFAKRLAEFVHELEAAGAIHQVMARGVKATNLETRDMAQKARGSSINQVMGSDLEASGDVKLGNLTQEGNNNE
jgi:hypothetical protein